MGSGWRRARNVLGLNHLNPCISAQPDADNPSRRRVGGKREASSSSAAAQATAEGAAATQGSTSSDSTEGQIRSSQPSTNSLPTAPPVNSTSSTKSSSRLSLIRTIRFSRSTCPICLESLKTGQGQALFTAECSHAFHFSCITSNVRHGNLKCPVCRAKWKELPWYPSLDESGGFTPAEHQRPPGRSRSRRTHHRLLSSRSPASVDSSREDEEEQRRADPVLRILDESIANARGSRRSGPLEPTAFDDDEPLPISFAAAAAVERMDSTPAVQQQSQEGDVVAAGAGDGEEEEEEEDVGSVEEAGEAKRAGGAGGSEEVGNPEFKNGGGIPNINDVNEPDVARQNNVAAGHEQRRNGEFPPRSKPNAEITLTCHPEVNSVPAAEERETFTVLVHLKSTGHREEQRVDELRKDDSESQQGQQQQDSTGNSQAEVLDPSCRAPLDLVTVLDVSGSMAGTKLLLLKRAMAFVIRNLSPADRLSVVAFSSSARRIFPLRRMTEDGRGHALRCIDSLVSTGGTNIADGLRKGFKILDERRFKNPMASIMLLSDGQDTYTIGNNRHHSSTLAVPDISRINSSTGTSTTTSNNNSSTINFGRLLPASLRHRRRHGDGDGRAGAEASPAAGAGLGVGTGTESAASQARVAIPVHTFGFGADHDAAAMHAIAEVSGGTFSFIQAEGAVQDAFAQCIGGLLSVVAQATTLLITTTATVADGRSNGAGDEQRVGVLVKGIEAGSYESTISENGRQIEVRLGDLYDEEERDVLLELKLPAVAVIPNLTPEEEKEDEEAQKREEEDEDDNNHHRRQQQGQNLVTLLRVGCTFLDPVSRALCQSTGAELQISRPGEGPGATTGEDEESGNVVCLEVDRQRNRIRVAQSIAQAGRLADAGEISVAQQILHDANEALHSSVSFQAGDPLSIGLELELKTIQERVTNCQVYETTGRAYLLSTQSSILRQRATTRGDVSENSSGRDYRTTSMATMVVRSQTLPVLRRWVSGASDPPSSAAGTATAPAARGNRPRRSSSSRLAISLSPTRMLMMRRSSGRVRDNLLQGLSL